MDHSERHVPRLTATSDALEYRLAGAHEGSLLRISTRFPTATAADADEAAAVRRLQVAATERAAAIKNRDPEMAAMLGDYGYERAFTGPEVHAVAIAVIARRSRIVGVDGHGVRAADEDVLAGLLEADVPIVASLLVESYLRAVLAEGGTR